MAKLVFYTNPMSRGRIVRWMLEEVGVPYETRILEYGTTMKAAGYLAVNPMGKVPAIAHGDVVVTECAAICAYLADVFPKAGLAPGPESAARGAYYRWLFFAAGPLEAAVSNKAFGFDVPEDKQGQSGYGSLAQVLDTLEALFADGRSYALGRAFSAVDVYLGSQIGWGLRFGTLEPRAGFEDYVKRISGRDAALRAAEIDDALMTKKT